MLKKAITSRMRTSRTPTSPTSTVLMERLPHVLAKAQALVRADSVSPVAATVVAAADVAAVPVLVVVLLAPPVVTETSNRC